MRKSIPWHPWRPYYLLRQFSPLLWSVYWLATSTVWKTCRRKCNSVMTEVIGPCKITTSTARYTLCSGGQSNGKERCNDPQDYECVFTLKIINIATGIRIRCPNTPRTMQNQHRLSDIGWRRGRRRIVSLLDFWQSEVPTYTSNRLWETDRKCVRRLLGLFILV